MPPAWNGCPAGRFPLPAQWTVTNEPMGDHAMGISDGVRGHRAGAGRRQRCWSPAAADHAVVSGELAVEAGLRRPAAVLPESGHGGQSGSSPTLDIRVKITGPPKSAAGSRSRCRGSSNELGGKSANTSLSPRPECAATTAGRFDNAGQDCVPGRILVQRQRLRPVYGAARAGGTQHRRGPPDHAPLQTARTSDKVAVMCPTTGGVSGHGPAGAVSPNRSHTQMW